MEQDDNYFGQKPETEKLRNVARMVSGIVNTVPEKDTEVVAEEGVEAVAGASVDASTEVSTEPIIDPVVTMVGKAIKFHTPKGHFMQGISAGNTSIEKL
jgi:hypothetical protein